MSTKVKGIFKGFKNMYNISTMFEEKNEDEIQIGFPTDVKHVAHIGLDGPSATTPAWMENMKSASDAPESSRAPATENSSETHQENSTKVEGVQSNVPKSKPSKQSRSSDGAKLTRSRRPSVDGSSDSSTRESSRHTRRSRHSNQSSESLSEETAEGTAAPKQHRRRKSKATNGEGSGRSSQRSSKGNSMTDISLSVVESGPQVEAQSESRF